jgi:type I restriction enzyme R subunit
MRFYLIANNGKPINEIAKDLLKAYHPDTLDELREQVTSEAPQLAESEIEAAVQAKQSVLIEAAAEVFTGELIALVSLVRQVCGIDETLTAYDRTVDRNFQQ